MANSPHKKPLLMIRRNLNNLPVSTFPCGWQMRFYEPGDETHWVRIQQAADEFNEITPGLFERYFDDRKELASRQFYLFQPGKPPIGTVTAWFDHDFKGESWGRVHWLAVLPEHQGQGLGKALFCMACRRLAELGHTRAYLTTVRERSAAVSLYKACGFVELGPEDG
jgi:GNAT superfamily N-acetyltransferase